MHGILLFAHGARDPLWAKPFEDVLPQLSVLRPHSRVALAYLEFLSPTLQEAAQDLIAAGCTKVDILPLFLGVGGHVRKDIPVLINALITAHPGVHWSLLPAIGEMPSFSTALAMIVAEATAHRSLTPHP